MITLMSLDVPVAHKCVVNILLPRHTFTVSARMTLLLFLSKLLMLDFNGSFLLMNFVFFNLVHWTVL